MEVSIKAGDIVGLIYDAFLKQYKIPDGNEKQESAEQKEKREHKLKRTCFRCLLQKQVRLQNVVKSKIPPSAIG